MKMWERLLITLVSFIAFIVGFSRVLFIERGLKQMVNIDWAISYVPHYAFKYLLWWKTHFHLVNLFMWSVLCTTHIMLLFCKSPKKSHKKNWNLTSAHVQGIVDEFKSVQMAEQVLLSPAHSDCRQKLVFNGLINGWSRINLFKTCFCSPQVSK